jgi:hypothetical protein
MLPGADALGSEVSRSFAQILRDVQINAGATFEGARQWVPITFASPLANYVLQGTLLVVAAIGALAAFGEHPRRFTYITTFWYLVMLVALPTRASRYLWPLYPLMTFAFIRGCHWLLDRAGVALGGRAPHVGVTVATLALAYGLYQDARSPAPRTLATEADTKQIVDIMRLNAAAQPRVAFFSPRVLSWEAGVTTTAFSSGTPQEIYAEIARLRLTHVVVGDANTSAPASAEIARAVEDHSSSFDPVFRNRSFTVYRFIGAADSLTR